MSKRNLALIGATIVSIIYGVTFTIAKDVMPKHIDAFGFILLRVGGTTLLFWLISLFIKTEKIDKADFPRIIAAAFFGVALNMLTFFKGLSYTSPIMGAVIMVTTPMIVLVLSAILIKERMKTKKILGLILGLTGTLFLILYGKSMNNAPKAGLGNLLIFINAVSYGFYLIIVKKLMDKYNDFSFVKWIYLFGLLMVLPFGYTEFQAVNWSNLPVTIFYKISFVVIFSTFLTYLLNLLSMKELKPTTVAVFIYLQPLFATIFAIGLGKDELNVIKIGSALLIFSGVYLVTQKNEK
ncbi:TPA: DMT family transporter [Flavobacterium psychrophilum]|uniref:DMT family transporter n=1 Tax=Flavobacterium psychrophilum TaxID=96345 RepID=UPI000B65178F|nr:DMT family transporter [Flavobacterium psychrophilum]SNB97759.1 putative drug/metabolite-transporting permease [Flavobacterium psychrophilum]GAW88582.1 multidrug transporter [Flavobacterium psychrophilum]GEJ29270.1 multidrug transporter [Flavobacterium psychrophilum]GEJ36878.1 multidrug transporter [Flavobacterium psychrophilum]GEJ37162.1 multidrug transporter [Flavobacterium psychrophilum]